MIRYNVRGMAGLRREMVELRNIAHIKKNHGKAIDFKRFFCWKEGVGWKMIQHAHGRGPAFILLNL